MKLVDLYTTKLVPNEFIDLGKILSNAAYPVNTDKEVKRLVRLSEDLFEDFYKSWETRFRDAIRHEFREGTTIHTIIKLVPYLTEDEYNTILAKTDEFIPDEEASVSPAKFALKIRELETHISSLMQGSTAIIKEEYQAYQEEASKQKIIRPNKAPVISIER